MQKTIYLLACLFIAQISIAQHTTIKGIILDNASTPVEYANVMLLQAADSTLYKGGLTETGGQYQFDAIEAGSYIILSYIPAW